MIPSSVDEVVAEFNGDSQWSEPRAIAQVVVSVPGSRKNGQELIEFIQKISATRGYSSISLEEGEIEQLMKDPLIEGGFSDVITRVCKIPIDDPKRMRELAVAELLDFKGSGYFGIEGFRALAPPLGSRDPIDR
jgi:hypothetical protein